VIDFVEVLEKRAVFAMSEHILHKW